MPQELTLVKRDVQSFNDQHFRAAKYWSFAAFHWVDEHNHSSSVNTGGLSPWEMIMKEKTTISNQFLLKLGEEVCVPIVGPDKVWRFDTKNDIGIHIRQPSSVLDGGRILFPWNGKVLVRASLSKVITHIDNINRWIRIRNEMMQGKLSCLLSSLKNQIQQKINWNIFILEKI